MTENVIKIEAITEISVQESIENSTAVAANIISSIENNSLDLT